MGLRRSASFALALLFAGICALMLVFPLPRAVEAEGELYRCTWEDGSVSEETYASAFADLAGIADGSVELKRGDHVGHIASENALMYTSSVLERGSLLELLSLDTSAISRIGRAALYAEYGNTVWYAGEAFCYTGERVARGEADTADAVVLLDGAFPTGYLADLGATELRLVPDAEFTAKALIGSRIAHITAAAPYVAGDGAVFRDTPSGRRLIAALPIARSLTLADSDFADEGALAACSALESISLPYIGTAKSGTGSEFRGEFALLFYTGGEYRVPASLKKATVTGGALAAFAFYACPNIEEINACGVEASRIARQAFLGADNLKTLHTPRADVELPATFTSRTAPCGCTVYERG